MLIITILLVAQFVPSSPYLFHAESHTPLELKVEEAAPYIVGDSIQLLIERNDEEITESTISLSSNALFDMTSVEKESSDLVSLDEEENELVIEWGLEESAVISLAIQIADEGEVEISSSNVLGEELYLSNVIQLSVDQEEDIPSEGPIDDELAEEDESSGSEELEEKKEEPDLEVEVEDAEEDSSEQISEEEQEATEDAESAPENKASVERRGVDDYRLVGNHSEFRNALEDANVLNIRIEKDFNVQLRDIKMNGDKFIDGNGQTVNFYGFKVKIGEYSLSVENMKVEAVQGNFPSVGTFNSDHPDAVLKLKDVSLNQVVHAQIARMLQGHIYVSGTSYFETSGPFEVFEAKNITFEEGATFTGVTTGTGLTTRKEAINLYNSPRVTIGKNATVRLGAKGKTSVLHVADDSAATINVLEGGKLLLFSENKSDGGPLLSLPNAGSEILMAKDTTLDIQNYRDGSNGALLNMNGKVIMSDNLSRVAFWDSGANTNNLFGDRYRYFSEVIGGELTFLSNRITTSHAGEGSSLSTSDNPDKDGQTFQDVFENRDTQRMKRLLISPVTEKGILELEVPERLNFEPTAIEFEEIIIPREDPEWSMRVKDTRGQGAKWAITAQAESPLKSRRGHELDEDALIFTQNNDEYSLKEAVLIQKGLTGETPETIIEWHKDEGIALKVNPMESEILADTEYATNIVWTIQDAP